MSAVIEELMRAHPWEVPVIELSDARGLVRSRGVPDYGQRVDLILLRQTYD